MTSERRIEANKRNAQHSTGPKTPEGKARSARNGTTHGLAGREIVLDGPERSRFRRRLDAWTAEHQPADDRERAMVERAAMAEVVLERIEAIDRRAWAEAREGAIERFDREQRERVDRLAARLHERPGLIRAELGSFAPGIDWLLERWAELEAALESKGRWDPEEIGRALALLGHSRESAACRRPSARLLELEGREVWDEPARRAVRQTASIEVARLRRRREQREPIDRLDRDEAPERAAPDPRTLRAIIRYGSQWSNALHRAIRDLDRSRRDRERAERAARRQRAGAREAIDVAPTGRVDSLASGVEPAPDAPTILTLPRRQGEAEPGSGEVARVTPDSRPVQNDEEGPERGRFFQSEPNEDRAQVLNFQRFASRIRVGVGLAASVWLALSLGLAAAGRGAINPTGGGRSEGWKWGAIFQTEPNEWPAGSVGRRGMHHEGTRGTEDDTKGEGLGRGGLDRRDGVRLGCLQGAPGWGVERAASWARGVARPGERRPGDCGVNHDTAISRGDDRPGRCCGSMAAGAGRIRARRGRHPPDVGTERPPPRRLDA